MIEENQIETLRFLRAKGFYLILKTARVTVKSGLVHQSLMDKVFVQENVLFQLI